MSNKYNLLRSTEFYSMQNYNMTNDILNNILTLAIQTKENLRDKVKELSHRYQGLERKVL